MRWIVGIHLLNWAFKQTDLKWPAKTVLVVLASHADNATHQCFPSWTQISGESGLSWRTVARCLGELESKKMISRKTQIGIRTIYTLYPCHADRGTPVTQTRVPRGTPLSIRHQPLSESQGLAREEKESTKEKEEKNTTVINRHGVRERPARIADNFFINEQMREWATVEGFAAEAIERETAAMIDHFRGSGTPKVDWDAVWRNWLRNSRGRFKPNGGDYARGQTKGDRNIQRAREILAEIDHSDRLGGKR